MESFTPLIIAVSTVALTALVEAVTNIGGLRPMDKTLKAIDSLDKEKLSLITHLKRERLEWQLSNNIRLAADPYSSLVVKACVILIVFSALWLIAYTIVLFAKLNAPINVIFSALVLLVVVPIAIVFLVTSRAPRLRSDSEEFLSKILELTLSEDCLTLCDAIDLLISEAESSKAQQCLILKLGVLSQRGVIRGFNVTRYSSNSDWVISSYGYLDDNAIYYYLNKGENYSKQVKRFYKHSNKRIEAQ